VRRRDNDGAGRRQRYRDQAEDYEGERAGQAPAGFAQGVMPPLPGSTGGVGGGVAGGGVGLGAGFWPLPGA
jgi:hypothetical protein